MAENPESAPDTETKKIINPRVEIDTSPPFESVKEAVDRFGGSGPWIPHHLLRLAAAHHDNEVFDAEKMEEHAQKLERDLIMKEQQTLNVLKELEAAKRFVEGIKVNLMPEFSSFMNENPETCLMNVPNDNSRHEGSSLSPGLMFMELNQAKLNLNKTSVDLAVIQASVESLNKKLRKDRVLLEGRQNSERNEDGNHHMSRRERVVEQQVEAADKIPDTSLSLSREVNFEAEQFKKMTEASRYEVMKAMSEIERTKNIIRMAEMRLNAAKKMEEAAKAVEAIAVAETRARLDGDSSSDVLLLPENGITLSFEEYRSLTRKAKQAEDMCNTKFIDTIGLQTRNEARQLEDPILEKFEETSSDNKESHVVVEDCFSTTHEESGPVHRHGNNSSKFKFRNSKSRRRDQHVLNGNERERSTSGFRSMTSIGDVLSRKVIVQDDVMLGRHVENHSEKQHVSLSQMLREQSRVILNPSKQSGDGNVEKQYFVQKKKFGFIQMPIPTRQSKKKTQH